MHPTHGLLLIDKPKGITSHDVVGRARRILGIKSIGHAGTLDPLASGLMILLIGEGTKVSDYLLNGNKTYKVKVRLGLKTDSMDITGQVLAERPVTVSNQEVRTAVLALSGALELDVPLHSAVKVDGKKLYEYAHKGETPDSIPKRTMNFHKVDVVEAGDAVGDAVGNATVTAQISCSKGSFIRAWANELGERLGCGGTVEELRRLESEPFSLDLAITLEQLREIWDARTREHGSALGSAWIPLKDSLPHFDRIDVAGLDQTMLRNGQISKSVQAQLLGKIEIGVELPPIRVINRETDDLSALLLAQPGQFYKIKRVFNHV